MGEPLGTTKAMKYLFFAATAFSFVLLMSSSAWLIVPKGKMVIFILSLAFYFYLFALLVWNDSDGDGDRDYSDFLKKSDINNDGLYTSSELVASAIVPIGLMLLFFFMVKSLFNIILGFLAVFGLALFVWLDVDKAIEI
jgi:glucan phosphoethanolaminetransferase (alkaline phosphatase superfamily)